MSEGDKAMILYDGACPLCRSEIELYRRQDKEGRLCLVDISTPAGAAQLPSGLSQQAALARFHVVLPSGEQVSGAAAFVQVWRRLPRWRRLARLAALPGVAVVLEGAYRLFLPARPLVVRLFLRARRGKRA